LYRDMQTALAADRVADPSRATTRRDAGVNAAEVS
jgi:hypothetical protein